MRIFTFNMKRPRYRNLAEYIKQGLETQEELATRLGVSQPTISRAKAGQSVSLRMAKRISAGTGVPLESLGTALVDSEVA